LSSEGPGPRSRTPGQRPVLPKARPPARFLETSLSRSEASPPAMLCLLVHAGSLLPSVFPPRVTDDGPNRSRLRCGRSARRRKHSELIELVAWINMAGFIASTARKREARDEAERGKKGEIGGRCALPKIGRAACR